MYTVHYIHTSLKQDRCIYFSTALLIELSSTASVQQRSSSALRRCSNSSSSSTTVEAHQQQKPCSSNSSGLQRHSPTSNLTQTSLELSPDNQVKLVTTNQGRKAKARHTKESCRRKRALPSCGLQHEVSEAKGKRRRGKGGSPELVSPTIKDYFKSTTANGTGSNNGCERVEEPERGEISNQCTCTCRCMTAHVALKDNTCTCTCTCTLYTLYKSSML